MSREIIFDYVYQHGETGRIINKVITLDYIECTDAQDFNVRGYSLIARRQFTGLQDKNGVDIYEGDIVCPLEINGTIAIAEIKYYLAGFVAQHFAGENLSVSASYMGPNIEVIGNIYENKDLL